MHGTVHDFVVLNTLKDGHSYPTGHNGVEPVLLRDRYESLVEQRMFKKVLDIGSLDICGSMKDYNFLGKREPWLQLIGNPEYTGIDITAGKNVDIVMDSHNLEFPDKSFDLVLCLEMLEHDTDAQKTLQEAYRVLEDGGLFLLATVDETHEEHGSGPNGYYRHITEKELKDWIKKAGFKKVTFEHFDSDFFITATK